MLLAAQTPGPPRREPEVVVTANRLADSEKAWRDCMARKCPPEGEIAAALAHAENQFLAGDYADGRRTLGKTIGRVRGGAERYPVPMGELWRTRGRLASHLGDMESYRMGMIEAVSALRAGLPADDPRVLVQRLELADAHSAGRDTWRANQVYADVAAHAARLGRPDIQGYAMLRRAAMWTSFGLKGDRVAEREARRLLAALVATTEPTLAPFRDAAAVPLARLDAAKGDMGALDRLVMSVKNRGGAAPRLLYSPPILAQDQGHRVRLGGDDEFNVARDPLPPPTGQFDGQWIDVGFWVAPDGSVRDAAVMRESARLNDAWVPAVLQAVGRRRYAPLATAAGSPGAFRVERVTYTSAWVALNTGTRIKVRDGRPRFVIVDLTADPELAQRR